MRESVKAEAHGHGDLPVLFVPGGDGRRPRQETVEKLMESLLQNENFLQTLRENVS